MVTQLGYSVSPGSVAPDTDHGAVSRAAATYDETRSLSTPTSTTENPCVVLNEHAFLRAENPSVANTIKRSVSRS